MLVGRDEVVFFYMWEVVFVLGVEYIKDGVCIGFVVDMWNILVVLDDFNLCSVGFLV